MPKRTLGLVATFFVSGVFSFSMLAARNASATQASYTRSFQDCHQQTAQQGSQNGYLRCGFPGGTELMSHGGTTNQPIRGAYFDFHTTIGTTTLSTSIYKQTYMGTLYQDSSTAGYSYGQHDVYVGASQVNTTFGMYDYVYGEIYGDTLGVDAYVGMALLTN
jgi:hypothetical protein